jgi:uncharacterized protein (DUF433 family)
MLKQPVTLEDYFDFLDDDATIRIKGHRVGIDLIIERYKAGETPEHIQSHFSTIRLEDIYATITYYLHHRERLDKWLEETDALVQSHIDEQDSHPSPVIRRVRDAKKIG